MTVNGGPGGGRYPSERSSWQFRTTTAFRPEAASTYAFTPSVTAMIRSAWGAYRRSSRKVYSTTARGTSFSIIYPKTSWAS